MISLDPGAYVFCPLAPGTELDVEPIASMIEDEGCTVVLPEADARRLGLTADSRCAWITVPAGPLAHAGRRGGPARPVLAGGRGLPPGRRDDDRLARAVSDGVSFGYLADVFGLPEATGQGVGKALVAAMLAGPDRIRWTLFTRDAHSLYPRFGFAPPDDTAVVRPGGV